MLVIYVDDYTGTLAIISPILFLPNTRQMLTASWGEPDSTMSGIESGM